MTLLRVRPRVLAFTAPLALMLVAASQVFACTTVDTLNLGQNEGVPGTSIRASGTESTGSTRPIELRWNAVNGPVLAKGQPDATGSFSTNVKIPTNATPGYYGIYATNGSAILSRATVQVDPVAGALSPAVRAPVPSVPAPVGTVGVGPGTVALMAGAAVLGLLLLGLGTASLVAHRRAPAVSRVRKD